MERESKIKNYIIFIMDILVVALVFSVIILLSNPMNEFFDRLVNIRKIIYAPMITVVIVFSLLDMYKNVYKKMNEVIICSLITGFFGFVIFYFFIHVRSWHLAHVSVSYWLIFILLTMSIMLERMMIEVITRRQFTTENILIVAGSKEAYKIGYHLHSNHSSIYKVDTLYVVEQEVVNIEQYILSCDKVILGSDIAPKNRSIVMELCQKNHKKVFMVPDLYDISIMRPRLTQIDDTPYLYLDDIGLTNIERDTKRVMDLIISILLIIILSPLFAVSMLLVRCSSRGPVFFRQERITKDNKVFRIIKFRTMIDGAEKKTGAILSPVNDQRVTKIGAFMRSTRLDELPQLFNVFIGDMSIIGPRPERPIFVNEYEKTIPLYGKRHTVKAGLSGLAQIMGKYSTLTQDKLRYDLIYIRSYSVLLDIKILFLTLKTVVLDLGSCKEENHENYKQYIEECDIKVVKG